MVLLLRTRVAAAFREKLGQQPEQKNPHQDGHIRNQHRCIRHICLPVLQPGLVHKRLAFVSP